MPGWGDALPKQLGRTGHPEDNTRKRTSADRFEHSRNICSDGGAKALRSPDEIFKEGTRSGNDHKSKQEDMVGHCAVGASLDPYYRNGAVDRYSIRQAFFPSNRPVVCAENLGY